MIYDHARECFMCALKSLISESPEKLYEAYINIHGLLDKEIPEDILQEYQQLISDFGKDNVESKLWDMDVEHRKTLSSKIWDIFDNLNSLDEDEEINQ